MSTSNAIPNESLNGQPSNKVRKEIPSYKGENFLFGSGLEFWNDPIGLMTKLRHMHPDIVRVRMAHEKIAFVYHPELAKPILQKTNKSFAGYPMVIRSIKSISGNNLFTAQGEEWKEQRKLLQPNFHKRALNGFSDIIVSEAEKVAANWSNNSDYVSIAEAMQQAAFNAVSRSLFSTDLEGQDSLRADYAAGANYITYRIENPLAPPLAVPTPGNIKIRRSRNRVNASIREIIAEREHTTTEYNDFLQMLLETRYEDTGEPLEPDLLLNQAAMFFFGGNGPPAKVLTWAFYYLNKYPEVEEKLHEELDRVLGGRNPTIEDLNELTYLQAIIDELLRLYPTAWAMPRQCVEDTEVGEYQFKKGDGLWVLLYNLHRHKDYWEDPEKFDPERFSPENTAKRPSLAYMPYGAGPRLCIAQHLSNLEIKTILATLCQRFRVRADKDMVVKPKIGFPLGPEGPVMMKAEAR